MKAWLLVGLMLTLLLLGCNNKQQMSGMAALECTNGSVTVRLCDGDVCKTNYSDKGCCPEPYHYCVYNGECYKENVLFGEQPEYYPKGMFCFRLVTVAPESHPPRWHDCDGGEGAYCTNYCGYTTAKSGEEGVGEYSYVGKRGCCGDDPNEYYIEGKDGTDACCKSPNRRVEGGVCVPTEQIITQKPAEQPTQESPEQDIPKPLTMLRGIMLWLELLGLISS